MKRILIFILFIGISGLSRANAPEYFLSFYNDYLKLRQVNSSNRIVLDFLYEITHKKILTLQSLLDCTCNADEKKELILLIDEEYKDFLENLNFEIDCIKNKSLSFRQNKKIKKQYKKFISSLYKCY